MLWIISPWLMACKRNSRICVTAPLLLYQGREISRCLFKKRQKSSFYERVAKWKQYSPHKDNPKAVYCGAEKDEISQAKPYAHRADQEPMPRLENEFWSQAIASNHYAPLNVSYSQQRAEFMPNLALAPQRPRPLSRTRSPREREGMKRGCVSLARTDMQQTERRPCDLSRISYFSQPSVRGGGCSYYMKASSSLFDVKVSPSLNSQRRLGSARSSFFSNIKSARRPISVSDTHRDSRCEQRLWPFRPVWVNTHTARPPVRPCNNRIGPLITRPVYFAGRQLF